MDKARMSILGSVPVVMALNLALLNHYFGSNTVIVNNKSTNNNSNYTVTDINPEINQYKVPKFFNTKKKLNITVVPPPPSHTFAGINE